ncbi:MAG: N-acetylmuramoyl-L-alanine amidase, partial [Bacillota bacterium]
MLIVIDPGHGGRDPGACGNGLQEKDITLQLARLVHDKLSRYEADVQLTRV